MAAVQSVITPQAPIIRAPHPTASLDTEALYGETVTIDQFENEFAHVVLATDGYRGWMPSACLGAMPDVTHQVIVPHSFVTAGADVKSAGISHLSLGVRLHLYPRQDDGDKCPFVEIEFNGANVFVPRSHISPLSEVCDDWVAVAESLIGSPYRWGGRSSTGLDCSALVQLSMAAAGMAVPRDSGPQHDIGQALDETETLQRGDLVFWAGHVGIMQDADRLLHANAYHMAVASEPLFVAIQRIAATAGPVIARRRP
jgi:hypothetical protein